jgi:hypothetical protein
MVNLKIRQVLPALLVPLLFLAGCQKKPDVETVTIEEDVVQPNGAVQKEWVVEELIPVPDKKSETVAGERPSNEHIWIPGAWERTGDKWEWQSGRWAKPPHGSATWMKGHWSWVDSKWRWNPGHWFASESPVGVTETIEPPPILAETIPEKPSDKNHWVAGYWDWDGHWIWIPGYWTTKPDPSAEWVPGHWDDFGLDGGFRWIGGHWRIKN